MSLSSIYLPIHLSIYSCFFSKGDKLLMINNTNVEDLTPKAFADLLVEGPPLLVSFAFYPHRVLHSHIRLLIFSVWSYAFNVTSVERIETKVFTGAFSPSQETQIDHMDLCLKHIAEITSPWFIFLFFCNCLRNKTVPELEWLDFLQLCWSNNLS